MLERLLIAGSGGQGVILAGRIVASAAMRSVPHVTFFPSYGAEVRGGTSNCQTVLSTDEIHSPLPSRVDSMIVMNQPSMERYRKMLVRGGLMIENSTLCGRPPGATAAISVPATEMAESLGSIRAANMILLGVYLRRKKLIPVEDVESEIRSAFVGKDDSLLKINIEAFHAGLAYDRSP